MLAAVPSPGLALLGGTFNRGLWPRRGLAGLAASPGLASTRRSEWWLRATVGLLAKLPVDVLGCIRGLTALAVVVVGRPSLATRSAWRGAVLVGICLGVYSTLCDLLAKEPVVGTFFNSGRN